MLTIQYEADVPPTFRIFAGDAPARIVVVMVQELRGDHDSVWVIGPPGMRMTEHPAGDFQLVEHRPATEQDISQIKARSEQLLGHAARPAASIQYGIVPPGFSQMKPASGSPPPLARGEKYEVVIMAAGGFGSLEFI